MAYCTLDDVQALIPTTIWDHDATSPIPTATQATDFLADVDAEIDARLAGIYSTPITGAGSLAVITPIAARLVAIRVWGVCFTGRSGDAAIPEDWKRAEKLLDKLAAGDASLPDAGETGAVSSLNPGAPAMTMRTIVEDPLQDVEMEPTFSMEDKF